MSVRGGDVVERGERIAEITDIFGKREAVINAPFRGTVIGYSRSPLVSQGDAVVHVGDLDPNAAGGLAKIPRR